MSKQSQDAINLQNTMRTAGWSVVENVRREMEKSAEDDLLGMFSRPDSLTGKKAIRLAARREALKDLKDELNALVAPLNP